MFYIVVYDTPSDKRRRRVLNLLKNFLFHVQFSVFEGHLPLPEYKRMVEHIKEIIDQENDSVRIFEIPQDAMNKVKVFGLPPLTEDKPYYMVTDNTESETNESSAGTNQQTNDSGADPDPSPTDADAS